MEYCYKICKVCHVFSGTVSSTWCCTHVCLGLAKIVPSSFTMPTPTLLAEPSIPNTSMLQKFLFDQLLGRSPAVSHGECAYTLRLPNSNVQRITLSSTPRPIHIMHANMHAVDTFVERHYTAKLAVTRQLSHRYSIPLVSFTCAASGCITHSNLNYNSNPTAIIMTKHDSSNIATPMLFRGPARRRDFNLVLMHVSTQEAAVSECYDETGRLLGYWTIDARFDCGSD